MTHQLKLNAKQLREARASEVSDKDNKIERNPLYLMLENVYDTYNTGGLFRLADALNVSGLYLCGDTETPPNHRILKASIGTYKIVPWVYKETAVEAIEELRTKEPSITIASVEQAENSIDYRKAYYKDPFCLIVGNETYGVTEKTLAASDMVLEIPMWGVNRSLNVIVSAAIVGYHTCLGR